MFLGFMYFHTIFCSDILLRQILTIEIQVTAKVYTKNLNAIIIKL